MAVDTARTTASWPCHSALIATLQCDLSTGQPHSDNRLTRARLQAQVEDQQAGVRDYDLRRCRVDYGAVLA
jgi:hypothetical protein